MKKLFFMIFISIGFATAQAQIAGTLTIFDTRHVENLPDFSKRNIRADLKLDRSFITSGSVPYSAVVSITPWSDDSGGFTHQLIFNNSGTYHRTGSINNNSWHPLEKFLTTDIKGILRKNLEVDGCIRAREVKIEANNWADFVFSEGYKLPALSDVENFIKENQHLPDIPSEAEVKANGIDLGEMQIKLLQKIEELTLYLIELKEENSAIREELNSIKKK